MKKILFDILNVLDWRLDLVIILCLMKIMYLIFLKIEDVFCQIILRGSDAVFANRTDNRKVREYSQHNNKSKFYYRTYKFTKYRMNNWSYWNLTELDEDRIAGREGDDVWYDVIRLDH